MVAKLIIIVLAVLLAACSSEPGTTRSDGWVSQGSFNYTKEIQTSIGTCVLLDNTNGGGIYCDS